MFNLHYCEVGKSFSMVDKYKPGRFILVIYPHAFVVTLRESSWVWQSMRSRGMQPALIIPDHFVPYILELYVIFWNFLFTYHIILYKNLFPLLKWWQIFAPCLVIFLSESILLSILNTTHRLSLLLYLKHEAQVFEILEVLLMSYERNSSGYVIAPIVTASSR